MKKKTIVSTLLLALVFAANSQENSVGYWGIDEFGLPCFVYTGNLPATALMKNGEPAEMPEDPRFLLGNYRLTLFPRVSGQYELVTGERAWGRMNQGDIPNSGSNSAIIKILDTKGNVLDEVPLTGMNSLSSNSKTSRRTFGCGFARYDCQTDQFSCSRIISVKPSSNPYNGTSAFVLTVKLTNKSKKILHLNYNESITACYEMMQQQRAPYQNRIAKYSNKISIDKERKVIKADIIASSDDPLQFPNKDFVSQLEGFPPALFLKIVSGEGAELISEKLDYKDIITGSFDLILNPGEKKELEMVIGYSFDTDSNSIEQLCNELIDVRKSDPSFKGDSGIISDARFGAEWAKVLPQFQDEKDEVLKREMTWNAFNLEAMATYSHYFKETKIPQGMAYDYDWGLHASARDHYQHGLPLCYYNPELAKSVLRYMMKKTTPWGEIRLVEMGYGYTNHLAFFTSDQQLFYFLLLSEYLRITGDYDFLLEEVATYPVKGAAKINSIDVITNCFRFLRDEVGVGSHGLVRLLNSDWNDAVYFLIKEPYQSVLYSGESHMNSAMAIVILKNLLGSLEKIGSLPEFSGYTSRIQILSESMSNYRERVLKAFMKELGDSPFSARMYFAGKRYGGYDNMFLEPQGYMMQIPELSVDQRKSLYEEVQSRLMKGEKLGAREQENPEFEDEGMEKGSRENGGFWYALNGPLVIGVDMFDKEEAFKLLKKMSFDHFAASFPDFWTSYWTAADNVESSLMPSEGLVDQTGNYDEWPGYCAHAHAWPLYCYYRLKE